MRKKARVIMKRERGVAEGRGAKSDEMIGREL